MKKYRNIWRKNALFHTVAYPLNYQKRFDYQMFTA